MTLHVLLFAVGLTTLTLGADWLVTGASRVATRYGVSPLMVGLTIVAFGTSAPELVVSTAASFQGKGGLAIGNIMGSTVANVGLIVGVGALIRPIEVHQRLLQRETPLLVFILLIVMVLSFNGELGRVDGGLLLAGFSFYLYRLRRWWTSSALPREAIIDPGPALEGRMYVNWVRVVLGLTLLILGARWLVDSAINLARILDVPEEVIGATAVAIGTSLPELASTIAAAVRGMGDIAMGNIIGSNIFNLSLVLGAAAVVNPLQLAPFTVVAEVVPALVFCLALIPLAIIGSKISRLEGALLLIAYGAFITIIL
jgi:cation:H+ antiporter